MKFTQTHQASVKLYSLIRLAALHNFFSCKSTSSIVSVQVRIFATNMRDIIAYLARQWEKHLSKRSFIKILVYDVINVLYYFAHICIFWQSNQIRYAIGISITSLPTSLFHRSIETRKTI